MDTTHLPQRVRAHIAIWHLESGSHRKIVVGQANLSFPEYMVLILTASGLKRDTVADLMKRSPSTVDKHLQKVRDKLNAHTSVAITHIAIKHNLVIAGEFTQI